MKPLETDLPVFYLKPGELYVGEGPALVHTILGSCVSVTMFNPRLNIGAICHALLAESSAKIETGLRYGGKRSGVRTGFRYVDSSVRYMLDCLYMYGITKSEIEVKIFGGADMFGAGGSDIRRTVGSQNVKKAKDIIEAEKLRLVAYNVGSTMGRKIYFYTDTGEVLLKRIRKAEALFREQEEEILEIVKGRV